MAFSFVLIFKNYIESLLFFQVNLFCGSFQIWPIWRIKAQPVEPQLSMYRQVRTQVYLLRGKVNVVWNCGNWQMTWSHSEEYHKECVLELWLAGWAALSSISGITNCISKNFVWDGRLCSWKQDMYSLGWTSLTWEHSLLPLLPASCWKPDQQHWSC